MRFNDDMLDALTLVSFLIGVANYNENLTQNDKAEIMERLDTQTTEILERVQAELEKQNDMLSEILSLLRKESKCQNCK